MMLSCCIILMEQALESVFVLPHAASIQADGNVHPIRISFFKLYYLTHLYMCLWDDGLLLFLHVGTEWQTKMLNFHCRC